MMKTRIVAVAAALLTATSYSQNKVMQHGLIVVDPGHFHASLLLRETYPQLAKRVAVYAPVGPEVVDFLNRVSLFNTRANDPTHWELDMHLGPDSMREMLRDRAGDTVVFTGKNRGKIERIVESVDAGLNVLADKPWIIASSDLPKLERALETAERKGTVAYDIMTERYEATSELQRVFVNDPHVFGTIVAGDQKEPGVRAKSIHHVMKVVAGVPLRRPAWFFDTSVYGEGLADVGTHVVDLVQWTAFADQAIDYRKDIQMRAGKHWPLTLTASQFQQVTGEAGFPAALASHVRDGKLDYFCNNSVSYMLRGVFVELEILWNWEAPEGAGDVYEATFRGTKSRVEVRQGEAQKWVPELYIVPAVGSRADVMVALRTKVSQLQTQWPGMALEERTDDVRIVIPEKFRVSHEAHFAQVTKRFFDYLAAPKSMPVWERPNMLAKYYVSTKGVELSEVNK